MTRPDSLTSLQHPLVKHGVRLRKESAYRREYRALLIEGVKPIQELSAWVTRLFYTSVHAPFALTLPGEKWHVTEAIVQKLSGSPSPEGVVAELGMPPFLPLGQAPRVLALDGISDPGNLGTLLRTALALGWHQVYFLPGCCDPFNEKALRAARGAHFKLALSEGTADRLKGWVEEGGVQPLAAELQGPSPRAVAAAARRLLVLGNEAHGVSESLRRLCCPVAIPMPGDMESLNVAVAGGILLYLLAG